MSGQRIDRPYFPKDFADLVSRVRKLEWHDHDPETDQRLTVFDEDVSLGEATELEFLGSAVSAIRREGGRIQVTVSGGGGEFDAIVDGTTTTDTTQSPPIFAGIGEALSYLATAGFTRAFVLVRPGAAAYTETGNWTNPLRVTLLGVVGSTATGSRKRPEWNHAGFSGSVGYWQHDNMEVVFGAKNIGYSVSGAGGNGSFIARNTHFNCGSMTGTPALTNSEVCVYDNCSLVKMVQLGGQSVDIIGILRVTSLSLTESTTLAGDWIRGAIMYHDPFGGSTHTWTLPSGSGDDNELVLINGNDGGGGINGGQVTIVYSGTGKVRLTCVDGSAIFSGSGAGEVTLLGRWEDITVSAPQVNSVHNIDCYVNDVADITGPARLNLGVRNDDTNITLRGRNLSGNISADSEVSGVFSSGTFLNFVNCDGAVLIVAHDGLGLSGTAKPYALDASSSDNFILFPNLDAWPVAGTDAGAPGTNNRVETTPSPYITSATNVHEIRDEGADQGDASIWDYVGAGVSVAVAGGVATVTIPGGGGGGGDTLVAWIGL